MQEKGLEQRKETLNNKTNMRKARRRKGLFVISIAAKKSKNQECSSNFEVRSGSLPKVEGMSKMEPGPGSLTMAGAG